LPRLIFTRSRHRFVFRFNVVKNLKSKLSKLHILDGLDYLNDDKNIMKEDTRSGLLRVYSRTERDMPNSYDEAWNYPGEKFQRAIENCKSRGTEKSSGIKENLARH